jgi:anthranilate/para-aminobenzoate synthase component II
VDPAPRHGSVRGLPNPFEGDVTTRSPSRARICSALVVTAETDDGEIMGMRHAEHAVFGVQFHPESILTVHGKDLLANFLQLARDAGRRAA